MSAFESELENLLGEFHIKMKGEPRRPERLALLSAPHSIAARCCPLVGRQIFFPLRSHDVFLHPAPFLFSLFSAGLAGFARLCPGDQYEAGPFFSSSSHLIMLGALQETVIGLDWICTSLDSGSLPDSSFLPLQADCIVSLLVCRSSCVTAASAGS